MLDRCSLDLSNVIFSRFFRLGRSQIEQQDQNQQAGRNSKIHESLWIDESKIVVGENRREWHHYSHSQSLFVKRVV